MKGNYIQEIIYNYFEFEMKYFFNDLFLVIQDMWMMIY